MSLNCSAGRRKRKTVNEEDREDRETEKGLQCDCKYFWACCILKCFCGAVQIMDSADGNGLI
jgi:hypothetical protein